MNTADSSSLAGAPRLLLFGAPRFVHGDGAEVVLGKRIAPLLALVALNSPVPRARIASMLYPQASEADARRNLRQMLFSQRALLQAVAVDDGESVALAVGVMVDALSSAVRNDPNKPPAELLGTMTFDDLPEFAQWLAGERDRLARERSAHLNQLADRCEQERGYADALMLAQRLVAEHPLSEAAHRRVMRLHYLSGDRAAAIEAFEHCERVLKDELGVRPAPDTLAMLRTIEQAQLAPVALRQVPVGVLRPPRLIGREVEYARLGEAWAQGRAVIVTGDAGLGKTRLISDFARARGGVLLVAARPGDARLPYAVLTRLVRQLVEQVPTDLTPALRKEIARLLPELGEAEPLRTDVDRARFVNALDVLLAQAAQSGVCGIVLDDLHFADAASIETAQHLSGAVPLRWIVAYRGAEVSAEGHAFCDELCAAAHADLIALAPLTVGQVADFVDSLGIEHYDGVRLAAGLHQRTGGNPLFLLEVLKSLLTQETSGAVVSGRMAGLATVPNVGELIQKRITRLSPDAIKLARCAAVAGQDFSAELAAHVLGVRAIELTDAWNELELAQVLREGAFAHDLIYEAALASVPRPIARQLHGEIAAWLETHGGVSGRIAMHWIDAEAPARALPALHAAAVESIAKLRRVEATQWWLRAGEVAERSGDLSAAFDAYFSATEILTHRPYLDQWAPFVDKLEALARSPSERAFAGFARAALLVERGQWQECLHAAGVAYEQAELANAYEAQAALEWTICVAHWELREMAKALRAAERAQALYSRCDPDQHRTDIIAYETNILAALAMLRFTSGRCAESLASARAVYERAMEAGRVDHAVQHINGLVTIELALGHLNTAQDWAERMRSLNAAQVDMGHDDSIGCKEVHVWVSIAAGAWGAALQGFEEISRLIVTHGTRTAPLLLCRQAIFHLALGRRDLAQRTLTELSARQGHSPAHALMIEVALTNVRQSMTGLGAMLERIVALDDHVFKSRLLTYVHWREDPQAMLTVLTAEIAVARDGGGVGFQLALQARRALILAVLARHDEALALARSTWALCESGFHPHPTLFPEFAADLAEAAWALDAQWALGVATCGRAWLERAAATLDESWRQVCLERSDMHLRLDQLLQRARLPSA